MTLAIIFLLTDLFMVGIAYAVYGRTAVAGYSDGMVLGVHIRREKQEDPVLVEFMSNYKKDVRRVYLGLGVSGVVICGLCFWYTSIFMCVWCVWFLCYIVGAVGVMFRNHRKLYDMKIQYRWGTLGEDTEESTAMAGVDTKTMMHSERMSLPLWYHFVLILILAVPFAFKGFRTYLGTFPENSQGWILFLTSVIVGVVFLWIAWIFKRGANRIYSENSELNFRINYLEKKSWSICFLVANICNAIAWLYLAYRMTKEEWIYNLDIIIYATVLCVPVIIAIAIAMWIKKQKSILQKEDETPLYMDDDYYWRNGWYDNPGDPRLFVQDRFNSMNYTTNFGKPAGRYMFGGICIVVVVLLFWMCIVFLRMDFTPIRLVADGAEVRITSGYTNTTMKINEIRSVKLLENGLPEDHYNRTNGSSDEKQLLGKFEGKKTGKCRMYVWLDQENVIEIKTTDYTVFINSKDADEMNAWYQALK